MLDYQERAKRTLRLLSTEFNEFIERLITHADETPGLLNTTLINQIADLITTIGQEKTEVSKKISDYYKQINSELNNRPYLEQAIKEIDISDSLRQRLLDLIDKHIFTGDQLKIIIALINETAEDVKSIESESSLEDELEMFDEKLHEQIRKQKSVNPV